MMTSLYQGQLEGSARRRPGSAPKDMRRRYNVVSVWIEGLGEIQAAQATTDSVERTWTSRRSGAPICGVYGASNQSKMGLHRVTVQRYAIYSVGRQTCCEHFRRCCVGIMRETNVVGRPISIQARERSLPSPSCREALAPLLLLLPFRWLGVRVGAIATLAAVLSVVFGSSLGRLILPAGDVAVLLPDLNHFPASADEPVFAVKGNRHDAVDIIVV